MNGTILKSEKEDFKAANVTESVPGSYVENAKTEKLSFKFDNKYSEIYTQGQFFYKNKTKWFEIPKYKLIGINELPKFTNMFGAKRRLDSIYT